MLITLKSCINRILYYMCNILKTSWDVKFRPPLARQRVILVYPVGRQRPLKHNDDRKSTAAGPAPAHSALSLWLRLSWKLTICVFIIMSSVLSSSASKDF